MKKFNEYVSEEVTYETRPKPAKTSGGHTIVGHSFHSDNTKHANIMQHAETGKYFAAGGSSTHPVKSTTFHDTPEAAAKSKKPYMKEDIAVCSECGEAPCNCDDSHGFVSEAAQGHTIEAHGIRGMKGTPWKKTFKNHEHLEKWADANDSVEVHATRDLDGVHKKTTNESADDHYAESEAHLNKASKALETSDMAAHHFHMSNHHEAKGRWHESKGRHSSADREYAKAEEHHEKSFKPDNSRTVKEESLDEISKDLATGYMFSAITDRNNRDKKISNAIDTNREKFSSVRHNNITKMMNKNMKRSDGIMKAIDRVQREEAINELSSDTLQSYKEKAKKSADELTAKGEHGKSLDRTMFRMRATGKQIDKTTASIKKALNREEVDLEEAHKIGSSVEVIAGSGKGIKGHIGEIRHGAFKGAPKTYTVFHGDKGAIQVSKEHIRAIKEGVKSPGIGWMLKQDPKLKAIVDTHKEKMKEFKAFVGTKAKAEDKK